MSASSMEPEDYNCWYDCENDQAYTEELDLQPGTDLSLLCPVHGGSNLEAVAQILDENGPDTIISSVQDAVNAATQGQRIYLLRDCEESVQIGKDKNVILDLNGYTLCSSRENVLDIRGKLEVDSTTGHPAPIRNRTRAAGSSRQRVLPATEVSL